MTRFDYTVSARNNVFVHYFRDHYHRTSSSGNIDYMNQDSLTDVKQYAVTDTHTFSPAFLNEATYSFMNAQSFVQATGRVPPRDMGINLDEGYLGVGMSLSVTGQFNLAFPGPERQGYRNWHWRDTMTMIRGSHTLKWGYEGMYVNVKRMGLALEGLVRKEFPGDYLQFVEMYTVAKPRYVASRTSTSTSPKMYESGKRTMPPSR